jgi:hypothetical protein
MLVFGAFLRLILICEINVPSQSNMQIILSTYLDCLQNNAITTIAITTPITTVTDMPITAGVEFPTQETA